MIGQHECTPTFVWSVSDEGNQRAATGNMKESPHFHKLRVQREMLGVILVILHFIFPLRHFVGGP